MKIRIYDTDFEGHPVECTGEYFIGKDALDIVQCMKMNPFNASLEVHDFIRKVLANIGQADFKLNDSEEIAAIEFLIHLDKLGYAGFEAEVDDDLKE